MYKNQLVKILSVVVTIVGMIVMFGWFLDIPILKSILPNWVTMKFSTALCFFLSGSILYFIMMAREGKMVVAQTFLPLPCMCITLIMASLLVSVFWGINTGIEDLFVQERTNAILTTKPGRPSVGTMLAFLCVVSLGFLTIMNVKGLARFLNVFGWTVLISGVLAIIGYLINIPELYYAWKGLSTAMAFHTAILFILLGIGLLIAAQDLKISHAH